MLIESISKGQSFAFFTAPSGTVEISKTTRSPRGNVPSNRDQLVARFHAIKNRPDLLGGWGPSVNGVKHHLVSCGADPWHAEVMSLAAKQLVEPLKKK